MALRCIHEHADIPERRRMEQALGWSVTGIHPVHSPVVDLFVYKRRELYSTPHFNHISLLLGPGKSYSLTFHCSYYSWYKCPDSHTWIRRCPKYDYPTIGGVISLYDHIGDNMLLTHQYSVNPDPITGKLYFYEKWSWRIEVAKYQGEF